MTESQYRLFQAIALTLAGLGAVVAFFTGLFLHFDQQRALNDARIAEDRSAREQATRQKIWDRTSVFLSDIAAAAVTVGVEADDPNTPVFKKAVKDFERLYWSKITYVDDHELDKSMDALRRELGYLAEAEDGLTPADGSSIQSKVKTKAFAVAKECRRLIFAYSDDFINK